MQFIFVRHGQSTNNLLWDTSRTEKGRDPDSRLTERGQEQTNELGMTLSSLTQDAARLGKHVFMYCSPMKRAIETAVRLAIYCNTQPILEIGLHEVGGVWEQQDADTIVGLNGLSYKEIASEFPQIIIPVSDSLKDGWWGGKRKETLVEAVSRAQRLWARMVEKHGWDDDLVIAVSHGAFFNALATVWMRAKAENVLPMWFELANGSFSRIDFSKNDPVARIYYLNLLPSCLAITGSDEALQLRYGKRLD